MLRATFTSLMARKMRLLMSATAIILGTAFVAGSLIFTDTLGKTFDGIMEGSVGDVVVQEAGSSGSVEDMDVAATSTIDPSVVDELADLPGAERADGNIDAVGVFVVGEDGNVVGGQGAPALAFNWTDAPNQLGNEVLSITSGRQPEGSDEVVIDDQTAERAGYQLGDEVPFVSSGSTPEFTAELVGTVEFGDGGLAGASISVFDTPTAQELFLDGEDVYTSVWVTTAEGTSQQELADAAAGLVPEGFEARAGEDVAAETQEATEESLSFITTFLLVFAGIALFVGSFLIINTFSILVAQRGRELALLRAIGASRRQVTRSVLIESLVVGLVGATVGLLVGILLAQGIKALFAQIGLDMSGSSLVIAPRTVVAAYLVGIIVTMLAAWIPARRAGRVPPVAAMRDEVEVSSRGPRVRLVLEVGVLLAGIAAFLVGLFVVDTRQVWWIGAGVVGIVLGASFLAAIVGRPVISGLGAIYRRLFGTVGTMAEQNTTRSPGRTAATASALMIGMTLVALMGVVSQSTKASVDKQIAESFRADYVLSNAVGQPFSPAITERAAEVEGVAEVSPERYLGAEIDDAESYGAAVDPSTYGEIQGIEMTEGSFTDLTDGGVLLSEDQRAGREVGDTVAVSLGGPARQLEVAGFYDADQATGWPFYLSLDGATALGAPEADNSAYVVLAEGVDQAAVADRLGALIEEQPLVTLKDQQSYADEQRGFIDQLLYIIYALLGLAIIIAILGIVNTLGLSVIERTREIGLLRAVGLSRRQLRRMIRLESVTIALLGAVLGIVIGVVAGVAIQRALVEDGITELAIPWGQLVAFVVAAGLVGVLAALLPARRAARMDVLEAISSE